MHWSDMIADPSIDAIIAVAPPEVTTEVALACAAAGKPVMATKPLFDHPETIRAPFYVDFWRLWSEAHARTKRLMVLTGGEIRYVLCGPGPDRGFPGVFDYGPHVMAALLDMGPIDPAIILPTSGVADDIEKLGQGELQKLRLRINDSSDCIVAVYGNGAATSRRTIWGHEETATHIGSEPKADILQRFCQSFLNDVSEGFVDTRLLNLSRDGMRELRKIREMAGA